MVLFLLLFLLICSASSQQTLIVPYAGSGQPNYYNPENTTVTAANIYPSAATIDFKGNMYIGYFATKIVKVSAGTNKLTTILSSNCIQVTSIWVDSSTNIYYSDMCPSYIYKISYSLTSQSYIRTKIIGNTNGYGGDGGNGTSASVYQPLGIWGDSQGQNLYIADQYSYRIRIYYFQTTKIFTYAGNGTKCRGVGGDNGPATSACMQSPTFLTGNPKNNDIYFFDSDNNRVRKISSTSPHIISTVQSVNVKGLWIDSNGEYLFYVSNNYLKMTSLSSGMVTTLAGTGSSGYSGDNGPASSAAISLSNYGGIFGDTNGNIYLPDQNYLVVRKVSTYTSSPQIITTVAGNGFQYFSGDNGLATNAAFDNPSNVWLDTSGNGYITDARNCRIRKVVPTTNVVMTIGGFGPKSYSSCSYGGNGKPFALTPLGYQLSGLWGDTDGNLYFTDASYIRKTPANYQNVSTLIHETGNINFIWGDSSSRLYYVVKTANLAFVLNLQTNNISKFAGTGTGGYNSDGIAATGSQLSNPFGIWVNSNGVVFIADSGNNRIRKVDINGIISTIIGTGTGAYNGNYLSGTSAQLNNPLGVVGDSMGNLFIADTNNYRIRMLNTSQVLINLVGTGSPGPTTVYPQLPKSVLLSPNTLFVDSNGILYYTISASSHQVYRTILVASPTSRPSTQPSSQPSKQPNSQPSSQPSKQPNSRPSSQPSEQPSSQPSRQPSSQPSKQPTSQPTGRPTSKPSHPTSQPSRVPSAQPSRQPIVIPSALPSVHPSSRPSSQPSSRPSYHSSSVPTGLPTKQPVSMPSSQPTTFPSHRPTGQPSERPSRRPSIQPTSNPSSQPTKSPTNRPTARPTCQPSRKPTEQPSLRPTTQPTNNPSGQPTFRPSLQPSGKPTDHPSNQPSEQPTCQPSDRPSVQPFSFPTSLPSALPSQQPNSPPTCIPSSQPTLQPSVQPSCVPTIRPTDMPSSTPSNQPTDQPTSLPTAIPSLQPSGRPTSAPSTRPSDHPTRVPSNSPTCQPTLQPAGSPSVLPSFSPSSQPTSAPSRYPTCTPTLDPTVAPTNFPSAQPSPLPSQTPSVRPSAFPTTKPSLQPVSKPSSRPSSAPSAVPSDQPTSRPSSQPSRRPSHQPSRQPTCQPSSSPSGQPTSSPITSSPTSMPTEITESPTPLRVPSISAYPSQTRKPTRQPVTPTPTTIPTVRPSFIPTPVPTQTISVNPSGNIHFKGSLFFLGSYLPAVESIPSIYLTGETIGTSYIIFGFKQKKSKREEIVIGSRNSQGLYSPVMNEAGLRQEHSMSRTTLLIGDFNGDTYEDLLICDPINSCCFLYFGHVNGFQNLQVSFAIKSHDNNLFGWSAAKLHDVNKDTFYDVAIAALSSNVIYIFYGSNSHSTDIIIDQVDSSIGIKIIGSQNDQSTGLALSSADDFNSDGHSDLLFSAIQVIPYQNVIYILFLNSKMMKQDIILDILTLNKDYIKIIAPLFSFAGFSLSNLGDVDQDGFDDIIIGSVPYSGRYLTQKSYVIYGRNSSTGALSLSQMTEEDGFIITGGGFLVAGTGDVNGDGIPDIMVSSYQQWQGKGNSYVMVCPRNITNPPTFFPSSQPTSVPSYFPTSLPSTKVRFPTNVPTFEETTNQPVIEGTFPPFLEATPLPSLAQKTSKPTRIPSVVSSTHSPTIKTNPPSTIPTRKPTAYPTRSPTILPSSTIPSRTPTERNVPSIYPTSSPSTLPTESLTTPFEEIIMDSEGVYNVPSGKANCVISGEGLFEITSNVGGKKMYTILPYQNVITITDFDKRHDKINLIHFPYLYSINDVVYRTNPLKIFLSSDQNLILPSLQASELTEDNFIFNEDRKRNTTFRLDFAAVVSLGIVIGCVGLFGCVTKFDRQSKECNEISHTDQESSEDTHSPEIVDDITQKNGDELNEKLSSDCDSLLLSCSDSEEEDDHELSITHSRIRNEEEEREIYENENDDWNLFSSLKSFFSSETDGTSLKTPTDAIDSKDELEISDDELDGSIDIEGNYLETEDDGAEEDIYFIQKLFRNSR
jgi:hypothetical protein